MEGDIKDIVLARLEKRLKDKDEEIRALKDRIDNYEDADHLKALEARVEHLEAELQLTQTTLSEVMRKVGAFEALIVAANCEDGECEDVSDPDLLLDGKSEPMAPDVYEPGVAASTPDADEKPEKKDAMRFFRMNGNS
jgi:hypothetical protein